MKIVELVLDEDQENTGIEAISIVDNPAIEADFIALKAEHVILAEVSKDKRILMGALLIPNKPIYRMSEDGEYYIYFSKETVEKASQMYLRKGNQNNATLEHQQQLQGLTLVESWIIEDEVHDKSKKYGLNLPVGTWMGSVKVESDELWAELKKKGGFSIEGYFADKMQKLKTIKPEMKKDEKEAEILLSKITSILKGEKVHLSFVGELESVRKIYESENTNLDNSILSYYNKVASLAKDANEFKSKFPQFEKSINALKQKTKDVKKMAKEYGLTETSIPELREAEASINRSKNSIEEYKSALKLSNTINKSF